MMNFLTRFFTNQCSKYLQRQIKNQQKAKAKNVDATQQEVYKQLKDLYNFVKYINTKALPNRHARKSFWARVKKGEPVLEQYLAQIIANYGKKKDEKSKV